ncbi:MAG: hypothetical protein OEV49_07390 [candidate division Zixibacteria bacterium]|nr:hypothetical protein [candidate division Zixibacteria bacterium]MDH3939095.1 hypothetical protein [candidate division Zixibacteria bacterium]MDH4034435.1 hypothetical protein [candidate division Zixibacteria bacterium]
MQRSSWTILLNSAIILILISATAMSAVPPYMNYQGRLTDDAGNPLDTTVNVTFTVYDDSTGGTPLWSEIHPSVTVTDGLFSVLLGTVIQMGPNVFDGTERYLAIRLSDGPEYNPRVPIVSVAYARRATHSDTAAFALAAPASGSPWTSNGSAAYLNNSSLNVGIGTSSPSSKLVVDGDIWATSTGAFGGPVFGRKSIAAYASGTGDSFAVWGTNSNGTAAGFYSGTNANVAPGTPTAVYARAGGDATAGNFSAVGDGFGLYAFSAGSRDAFRAQTTGTQYAGRFLGGLGVKVDGNLDVAGSFKLPTGASAGHVLTSDATGVAAWQASTGSSPWSANDTVAYLTDTSSRAMIGVSDLPSANKMSILTDGIDDNMALWTRNVTGTAAGFFSADGGNTWPSPPAAVYARAGGDNYAGRFDAKGNGDGISVSAMGIGTALYSSAYGTGFSGIFSGGSGVLVDGDLGVTGTAVGDGAVNLPDSSVSSDEILDEPGIAVQFRTTSVSLPIAGVDVETVTLTTPAAGYVHITAFCTAQLYSYTGKFYAAFQINDVADGAVAAPYVTVGMPGYSSNDIHKYSVAVNNVFYKEAGTHTFYLRGRRNTPGGTEVGTASADDVRMVAVFYPSSYGEVATTIAADDAGRFDNTELIPLDHNSDDAIANNSTPLYKVDLRELELKAARARAEAEKAERELIEAQMREQREAMSEEVGR